MDDIPQQAYSRMRMCRAMVNDHFTPAYLAAMTSAMAAFADGYPAVRQPQSQAAPAGPAPDVSCAACSEPASASAPAPLPGSHIPAAGRGSDVMERSRRGRSRIAVPGTAKPRPMVANAQTHAKDA